MSVEERMEVDAVPCTSQGLRVVSDHLARLRERLLALPEPRPAVRKLIAQVSKEHAFLIEGADQDTDEITPFGKVSSSFYGLKRKHSSGCFSLQAKRSV